jgi:predicted phosphodiesterase
LSTIINQGGEHIINLSKFENKPYRFGIVSDNHLNSKYERLDVLNALYDYFAEQGITEVFNAGNWVDGECRFNKYEIINHGISPQIKYFVEKYPQRKGITTYFIAGDDHEGWWVQRERIDIGRYAQMMAEEAGRNDLKYLGYMEYDVILKQKQGQAIMRIMHPGGGSAYALSYSPQKTVEAFQGGEKPQILILGHYHKADYMYYRDVHIVQAGCTQDQSLFLRKQKIQVALGGWIIELSQSKDGAINRFKSEWIPFLDKQYYHRNGYYR